MRISSVAAEPYVVLDEDDYVVLGPEQFGSPGLTAIESIGPFVAAVRRRSVFMCSGV